MSNIVPFKFKDQKVRVVIGENGDPWWVAKDACEVLGHSDPRKAVQMLDDDERKKVPVIDSLGREQNTFIINESGLYTLILRSNKPQAKPFRRWVTSDVLPSIRKTGRYESPAVSGDPPATLTTISRELRAAKSIARTLGLGGNQAILSANRITREITGVDCLTLFNTTHLIAEVQDVHLTPTDIGIRLGLSGTKVNKLLQSKGFQVGYRDHKKKQCWKPTEKGKPFAVLKDTGKKSGGTPVVQLFWLESILETIEREADPEVPAT